MDNNELLLAITEIIDSFKKEIREEISDLKKEVNARFNVTDEQLSEIKEDTEITRTTTNALVEWAENGGVVATNSFPIRKAE